MEEKQKKMYPYKYKFWNTPLIMFRPNINYDAYISQWFIVCTFRLFFFCFFKFLSRGIPSPFVCELFYFVFVCAISWPCPWSGVDDFISFMMQFSSYFFPFFCVRFSRWYDSWMQIAQPFFFYFRIIIRCFENPSTLSPLKSCSR